MSSSLSRIVSRLWDLRYVVPLTPLGVAVLVTAGWLHTSLAVEQQDFVLYAAARVALLMLGSAVLLVLAASTVLYLHLRASRNVDDLQLESGVRAATGFSFPRFARWPMVQVRLRWADPGEVEASLERTGGILEEVVTPHRRGRVKEVRRRFIVTDIFGLARLGLTRAAAQRVRIAPGRATATGNTLLHFSGGDALSHPTGPAVGELLDMRRYGYGDPLRHVLWKAYARTRQLLVRTAEHAIQPTPSAMAYFVSGPGDEATASVARFFIEHGLLGLDFRFMADGADGPTSEVGEAVEQVIESVHHYGQGGARLRRFLEAAAEHRGRQCVLFLPPVAGAWLERVTSFAARLKGANVVLAIDDDLRVRRRGFAARLLFSEASVPQHNLRGLAQLIRRLTACGMHVSLVHRPSGELVPLAQLEALA